MKEKPGVEYTETDTEELTYQKENLKCAETSLFAMLCTVFSRDLSSISFYALALSILPVEERGN